MKTVNIHQAKTHLSRLVEEAAAGEDIVIAKAGKPVARLGPVAAAVRTKRFGVLRGKITVPADFNEPLPEEILAAFEAKRA